MPEFSAFPVQAVANVLTTDDGQTALIRLTQPGGREITIAVPQSQLLPLVEAVAVGVVQGQSASKRETHERTAFKVRNWELGKIKGSNDVVLSLILSAGGMLSFHLHGNMPTALIEALQGSQGQLPAGQAPTTTTAH